MEGARRKIEKLQNLFKTNSSPVKKIFKGFSTSNTQTDQLDTKIK